MKKIITGIITFLLIFILAVGPVMAGEEYYMDETVWDFEPGQEFETTSQRSADDYSYLFENRQSQKRSIVLAEVERIAILFTSNPLPQSLMLDLEDRKSYYDPDRDIYYNIQVSKYINDLNDSEMDKINNIWEDEDFANWDFYYEGSQELDYVCHFAIETKDEIFHYTIKGVDAPAPDALMDFITNLLHAFWDPQLLPA